MTLTFGEAIHLVNEIQHDLGSHLSAEILDWQFASGYGELLTAIHLEAFMNANRDEKKQREPFQVLKPWDDSKPRVSDQERAELEAQLSRRSAFR